MPCQIDLTMLTIQADTAPASVVRFRGANVHAPKERLHVVACELGSDELAVLSLVVSVVVRRSVQNHGVGG